MDTTGLLDMEWWHKESLNNREQIEEILETDQPEMVQQPLQCTYSGRPFGTETFLIKIGRRSVAPGCVADPRRRIQHPCL